MNADAGIIKQDSESYSRLKYSCAFADIGLTLAVLFIFAASGFSKLIKETLAALGAADYFILPLYLLILGAAFFLLDFPLNFYRSYILEHKFRLSNQKIPDWWLDQLKSGIISYIIALILAAAFYGIIKVSPKMWWLGAGVFWIFFSLILAKLVPIAVIPLFFKYKKIEDTGLAQRIVSLAEKFKICPKKPLEVFEIDFSKKTLKANAAFVGIGNTRRVILADTLKEKYSADEIEVILAHEFAHYRKKHLLKLLFINASMTLFIFYLVFKTNSAVLGSFGFSGISDIAALPVLLIYFSLFGLFMRPLEAFLSRVFERQADRMALEATQNKAAFVSMMEKLAIL
jgi:STE24 endopeptidase